MKKIIMISAFLLLAGTASAGETFGASLKPTPNLTLFGQKISWPIPSLCLGAKAGVTSDASVSSDGIKFKIPYLALELPFPALTLGFRNNQIELKLGEVNKSTR
jgi:hypothetical protein